MTRFKSRVNTGGKYMSIRQYHTKNGRKGAFKGSWGYKKRQDY